MIVAPAPFPAATSHGTSVPVFLAFAALCGVLCGLLLVQIFKER
jgi:hypothetical protein